MYDIVISTLHSLTTLGTAETRAGAAHFIADYAKKRGYKILEIEIDHDEDGVDAAIYKGSQITIVSANRA